MTGYSQTTVKEDTGPVGILTADELKLKPQTSVDALMQGELAGVSVTPTTDARGPVNGFVSAASPTSRGIRPRCGWSMGSRCRTRVRVRI